MKKIESINPGDFFSKKFIADDKLIREIARVSGDINPVHLDEDYAKKTIFKKKIAHGLFCLNGVSMILGNYFPGEGTVLLNQTFNYKKPVYIGDEVEITIIASEVIKAEDIIILDIICKNQNDKIVMDGNSKIKLL